jgi:hypothetical protein
VSFVSQMEKQLEENNAALQAFKAEVQALNAALQSYISRPDTPPPSASDHLPSSSVSFSMPDIQSLVDALGPLVLESVREDIKPTLEQQQESVRGMLQRQNEKMAQAVMGKLQLTLNTVEVIYAWMNRTVGQEMSPRTPIPVSQLRPHLQGQMNGVDVTMNGDVAGSTSHAGPPPVVPTGGLSVLGHSRSVPP